MVTHYDPLQMVVLRPTTNGCCLLRAINNNLSQSRPSIIPPQTQISSTATKPAMQTDTCRHHSTLTHTPLALA